LWLLDFCRFCGVLLWAEREGIIIEQLISSKK
jgi:hypothetical protein